MERVLESDLHFHWELTRSSQFVKVNKRKILSSCKVWTFYFWRNVCFDVSEKGCDSDRLWNDLAQVELLWRLLRIFWAGGSRIRANKRRYFSLFNATVVSHANIFRSTRHVYSREQILGTALSWAEILNYSQITLSDIPRLTRIFSPKADHAKGNNADQGALPWPFTKATMRHKCSVMKTRIYYFHPYCLFFHHHLRRSGVCFLRACMVYFVSCLLEAAGVLLQRESAVAHIK